MNMIRFRAAVSVSRYLWQRPLGRRCVAGSVLGWNNYPFNPHSFISTSQIHCLTSLKSSFRDANNLLRSLRLSPFQSDPDEEGCSDEEWSFDELCSRYGRIDNCVVTPYIQVFSISLHKEGVNFDFDNTNIPSPIHIYGSISVTNHQGAVSNLYDRSIDNPETIPYTGCGSLCLRGGYHDFIPYGTVSDTTLDLDLKDTLNNIVFKEKHNLHSLSDEIEDTSNKLLKAVVPGDLGFAIIYYSKLLFATPNAVKVAIFNKRDTASPHLHIYGDIVARFDNAREFCNNDGEVKHTKCTLFSRPFDHPQLVTVGRTMKLSRFVVAVPALSSLVIDVDIWDSHGRFVGGSVEFPWPGESRKSIDDEFGNMVVIVHDDTHADRSFFPGVELEDKANSFTKNSLGPVFPSLGNTPSSLSTESCPSELKLAKNDGVWGDCLVEVFSAYMGGTGREISAVCGNISVSNHYNKWNIFERGVNDLELVLLDGKGSIVSLEGHRAIEKGDVFKIDVHLKDLTNNKDIFTRVFHSDRPCIFGSFYIYRSKVSDLWDKRLCSFLKGSHGYVLLHYIMLRDACQATVEIKFIPDHPSYALDKIHGTVFASYSNHNYSTKYEKEYFRSRLFDKAQVDGVQADGYSRLPLLKTVVVVPLDAALVIEVDLQAMFKRTDTDRQDSLCGKKVLNNTKCHEILGKYCRVKISAKFQGMPWNFRACTTSGDGKSPTPHCL